MLDEYRYKFNDLVNRIKINSVVSVVPSFTPDFNVDVGADIEAFIIEKTYRKDFGRKL